MSDVAHIFNFMVINGIIWGLVYHWIVYESIKYFAMSLSLLHQFVDVVNQFIAYLKSLTLL